MTDTFDFSSIRADFADDVPRMLYADWLGERGEPERGELVSLQVRLARCEPSDAARHDLHHRAAALLKKHSKSWLAPLKPLCMRPSLTRGLVERVRVRPKNFPSQAAQLFEEAPALHAVWCSDMTRKTAPTWTTIPELAHLDRLELFENRLGAEGLAQVLDSPHLTGLTELGLRDVSLDEAGMGVLASWEGISALRELSLAGNPLSAAALPNLLALLPHLTTLNLSGTRLSGLGRLLRQSPPQLRHLNTGWNPLLPVDWTELGAGLPDLTSLQHDSTGVSAQAAREIAAAPWKLQQLRFFQAQFDDEAFRVLCSGDWPALKVLKSDYNKLTEAGWSALDRDWPALEELYIDPPPTAQAARALHRLAPQLRKFTFWGSKMTDEVMAALLEVPWPRLHSLTLGHAQLTDAIAPRLADVSVLPVLNALDLGKAPVQGAALRQLRKRYGWGLTR